MKPSAITETRREQILQAAIQTLGEIGYVKASLAQIAKRAGLSTALISYHFADKSDLYNHLLEKLVQEHAASILEKVGQAQTPHEQLQTFITASLDYQRTHLAHNKALIEIIFHARTADHTPYYQLKDDGDDPVKNELLRILRTGQEEGDFGEFHVEVMANLIQGAIGEYMLNPEAWHDLDVHSRELVRIVNGFCRKGIDGPS